MFINDSASLFPVISGRSNQDKVTPNQDSLGSTQSRCHRRARCPLNLHPFIENWYSHPSHIIVYYFLGLFKKYNYKFRLLQAWKNFLTIAIGMYDGLGGNQKMVVMANRSVCFGWGAKSRDYDDERAGGWDQTELSFFFFFFLSRPKGDQMAHHWTLKTLILSDISETSTGWAGYDAIKTKRES